MMIHEVCGMSSYQYLKEFDRRNLLAGEWDISEAIRAGVAFRNSLLLGSTVVVLGREVWRALGLKPRTEPGESFVGGGGGQRGGKTVRWVYLPHPSGRNMWYNEEENRAYAGRLLADLVERVPA
jgi:hypothetical protein